jgi:hypothetical protein
MLKINQLYTDFVMMVDETEMNLDSVDTSNEILAKKELAKELEQMDSYKTIFKRFEGASKMRSWYQEKKKSWEKKKKDGDAKADEDKKDDNKEIIKQQESKQTVDESNEEKIDTTKTDNSTKKKTKDQVELAKIVDKVIEKAELLIKLAMPTTWGTSPNEAPELKQNMSERDHRDKEEQEVEEKGDWVAKLNTWKERQGASSAANDKKEQDDAVFTSISTSVLACLQTPITAQRIKKQIENIYVSAMKRICGFRLIARLSYMNHNVETRTDYLNWFCSSLRQNTNVLTHYTNEITGCGEHLQNELRKSFFLVFNGIIRQVRECEDKEDIKFLLNCCKWQFTASDHDFLIRSGIFEVLSDGNGNKEKDKNPIKFCWGHTFKFAQSEDYPL